MHGILYNYNEAGRGGGVCLKHASRLGVYGLELNVRLLMASTFRHWGRHGHCSGNLDLSFPGATESRS